MLALLGDRDLFSEGVNWIGKNLRFDKVHFVRGKSPFKKNLLSQSKSSWRTIEHVVSTNV